MDKKHTNSGPLMESADKHSIYTRAAWTSSDAADAIGRGGNSIPSRWRQISILRQGASPKVRKVLHNMRSKT